MSKHTPGELKAEGMIIVDTHGNQTALTIRGNISFEECEANAKHIVKCWNNFPAMHRALKAIMENLIWVAPTNGICEMPTAAFTSIKSILAKLEE